MSEEARECFAKSLVHFVRDQTIQHTFREFNPSTRTSIGKLWFEALSSLELTEALKLIMLYCIDDTIYWLLNAIDNEEISLTFEAPNGDKAVLTGDGELAGWYVGEESWRQRYSKEKVQPY